MRPFRILAVILTALIFFMIYQIVETSKYMRTLEQELKETKARYEVAFNRNIELRKEFGL